MMKPIVSFVAFLCLVIPLVAQKAVADTPFVLGTVKQIYSAVLSETRTLNIYLPAHYSPDSAKSYPVIYLLDGSADEDFVHISGIVQFLNMLQLMPETIVVGIENVDRRRDYSFPTTVKTDLEKFPTTGHSDKFIRFISEELQPFIKKEFKTNNETLIGQSFGGLLATEILIKRPELFDDYIIVSPSLWWDNGSLITAASTALQNEKFPVKRVYLSVGTEGKQMEDVSAQLAELLKPKMNLIYRPMPEETHLTILHNCVYNAMMHLYGLNKQGY